MASQPLVGFDSAFRTLRRWLAGQAGVQLIHGWYMVWGFCHRLPGQEMKPLDVFALTLSQKVGVLFAEQHDELTYVRVTQHGTTFSDDSASMLQLRIYSRTSWQIHFSFRCAKREDVKSFRLTCVLSDRIARSCGTCTFASQYRGANGPAGTLCQDHKVTRLKRLRMTIRTLYRFWRKEAQTANPVEGFQNLGSFCIDHTFWVPGSFLRSGRPIIAGKLRPQKWLCKEFSFEIYPPGN